MLALTMLGSYLWWVWLEDCFSRYVSTWFSSTFMDWLSLGEQN